MSLPQKVMFLQYFVTFENTVLLLQTNNKEEHTYPEISITYGAPESYKI